MCLLTLPLYPAIHNQVPNACCSQPHPCYLQHHFATAVIESQRRVNYFFGQQTMLPVLYHVTKTELRPAFSDDKSTRIVIQNVIHYA
jgi:hypothetical protein